MPIGSGGAAGNTTAQVVASGKVLPVAVPASATVDATTYTDPIHGFGLATTLVLANERAVVVVAQQGDAFPRWALGSDTTDTMLVMGDGTFDPSVGLTLRVSDPDILFGNGRANGIFDFSDPLNIPAGTSNSHAAQIRQVSPKFTITSGALPTATLSSGVGAQIITTRDAETVTPFTGDGTNNAATCAIALSPDNVTYSTLATISIAAALNLTGVLTDTVNVRVPAAWYLKLTAVHGTLGTTSYY